MTEHLAEDIHFRWPVHGQQNQGLHRVSGQVACPHESGKRGQSGQELSGSREYSLRSGSL